MHFYEPLRSGMPRGGCADPYIIPSPRARECPDPYIFQLRSMPGSIHFDQSPRTTVRRKASAAALRSHVQRGLRVVEAGPVIARSMSPSDQDVSTTPAMRRCNSSRSPIVSGSLHFYASPCTGGPRSLHFHEPGALTGQDRPEVGVRIPAFLRAPAPGRAQIPAFLRLRRPDRPKPASGGSPDPCIFMGPRARRCPNPCSFTGPAP